jgi:hypothetical protein
MKNSKESSFDFYEDIIIPQSERFREFSDWSEKYREYCSRSCFLESRGIEDY